MNDKTVGATRARLTEMGYAVTSAASPGNADWRAADDLAAILCVPSEDYAGMTTIVATLVVTGAVSPELRAELTALFDRHGIAKCPVRTATDGTELRLARYDGYGPPMAQTAGEGDAAVILESTSHPEGSASALVRLDGQWRNGSPLTTPRMKLPMLNESSAAALMREAAEVQGRGTFCISADRVPARGAPAAPDEPAVFDEVSRRWRPAAAMRRLFGGAA